VRRSRNSRAGRTGFRDHGAGVPGSRRPAARSSTPRTVIRRVPALRHPLPGRRAARRRPRQRARPVLRPPGRRRGLLTRDRLPRTGPVQDRAPAASPERRLRARRRPVSLAPDRRGRRTPASVAPPLARASAARCPPGRPLALGLPALRLPGRRPGLGQQGPRLPGRRPGLGQQGPRLPGRRPGLGQRGPRLPGRRPGLGQRGPRLPGPHLPGRGPQGPGLPDLRLPGPRAAPELPERSAAHPGLRRPRPPELPHRARALSGPAARSGP